MRAHRHELEALGAQGKRDKELLSIHGWLSPGGELFTCGYKQHDAIGRVLGFKTEGDAEAAGYCKLTGLEWLVEPRHCAREITSNQWSTIRRWYETNGFPMNRFERLVARSL